MKYLLAVDRSGNSKRATRYLLNLAEHEKDDLQVTIITGYSGKVTTFRLIKLVLVFLPGNYASHPV